MKRETIREMEDRKRQRSVIVKGKERPQGEKSEKHAGINYKRQYIKKGVQLE